VGGSLCRASDTKVSRRVREVKQAYALNDQTILARSRRLVDMR